MDQAFIKMSLAVADAIVARRQVSWIALSNGQKVGQ
jgi:hypothetical protein